MHLFHNNNQNSQNIVPQSPVFLGLCSGDELEKAVVKARKKAEKTTINEELDETKTSQDQSSMTSDNDN